MSRRRCCCGECVIYQDNFNRDNSETVDGWTEVSGSWSIYSNELRESGTSGAVIIANVFHSNLSWYVFTNLGSNGIVDGAKYRLIANYLDSSNYLFAEYIYNASALSVTIKLCSMSSGSPVVIKEKTFDEDVVANDMTTPWVTLDLCLDPTIFSATLYNKTTRFIVVHEEPTLIASGYKVGLGNGSALAITYDDFYSEDTNYHDPLCRPCTLRCCAICPGWHWDERDGKWFWSGSLCMTLESPECPSLYTEWILEHDDELPTGTYPVDDFWRGYGVGYFSGQEVQLWCNSLVDNVGCFRYRLRGTNFSPGFADPCGIVAVNNEPDECTCPDPLTELGFELIWYTETWNLASDPESLCNTSFCADGKQVIITVFCCPEATTPWPTTPHGTTPHATTPHGTTPHSTTPHATTPHPTTPHGTTPHGTTPHSTTPHGTTPHGTTPHSTTPHGTTPHATTPHGTTPHGTTPHATTPHGTTPHGTTPHGTTPHSTTPHGTTPHSTTPHGTTPHGTTPHSTTPHSTTPHGTTPHGTTPHGTTPHGTTPHSTTPHGTTPHGTTPHGTTPHGTTPHGTTPHPCVCQETGNCIWQWNPITEEWQVHGFTCEANLCPDGCHCSDYPPWPPGEPWEEHIEDCLND